MLMDIHCVMGARGYVYLMAELVMQVIGSCFYSVVSCFASYLTTERLS